MTNVYRCSTLNCGEVIHANQPFDKCPRCKADFSYDQVDPNDHSTKVKDSQTIKTDLITARAAIKAKIEADAKTAADLLNPIPLIPPII